MGLIVAGGCAASGDDQQSSEPAGSTASNDGTASAPGDGVWISIYDGRDSDKALRGWLEAPFDVTTDSGLPPTEKLDPPRDGSTEAIRFKGSGTENEILFHMTGVSFWASLRTVRFWARSDINTQLVFAITGARAGGFWVDQRQGIDWPSKEIAITPTWMQYEVDVASLAEHPEPSIVGGPITMMHWISAPGKFDIWLDRVEMRPLQGGILHGDQTSNPGVEDAGTPKPTPPPGRAGSSGF
jgi:hypothetical protein